jgi:hypothetical protein
MKRRGLSGACIEGMLSSQAPYVAVIDADLQHDERLLPRMLERLRSEEADIVIGSRYSADHVPGLSSTRLSSSRFATWIAVRLLGIRATDPLSGFFMLRRSMVEMVAPRLSTQGFKILVDILATIGPRARLVELPYTFQARQHGRSWTASRDRLYRPVARQDHRRRHSNALLLVPAGRCGGSTGRSCVPEAPDVGGRDPIRPGADRRDLRSHDQQLLPQQRLDLQGSAPGRPEGIPWLPALRCRVLGRRGEQYRCRCGSTPQDRSGG